MCRVADPFSASSCETSEWLCCRGEVGYETSKEIDQAKETLYFRYTGRGFDKFYSIYLLLGRLDSLGRQLHGYEGDLVHSKNALGFVERDIVLL